jgi:hypothetical protein
MNIVKLQNDLKGVPDQSLIGYVQNPNGQVPTYLALSELQRRKKMREQVQGEQNQGAQPSVAEQLVSEAQPQAPQGIAGIPVDNVGSEEAYAAGGIIAFEDGGEVQHFDNGGATSDYNRAIQGSFLGRGLGSLDEAGELAPTQGNMFKRIGNYIVDTVSGQRWVNNPYTGKLVRAKDVVETPNAGALTGINAIPNATNVTGLMSPELPTTRDTSLPAVDTRLPMQESGIASTTTVSKTAPARGRTPTTIKQPQGIEQLTFDPIKDRSGEFEYTKDVDAREAAGKFKDIIGENPFQAKAAEKLASMEAANAKYGEQMPWMSLAEAGLAMASGKSPFAISNIAEGGMKGVAAYKAGQDKLRDVEDKIFNAQAKVAEAQRAEDLAAGKYGMDSEQAAKAAKQREKAQVVEYKSRLEADNVAGKLNANKFNLEQKFEYDRLAQQERAANARLDAQLKAAEKRAVSEDKKLEIASLRSAVTSSQSNLVSARKAYSDLIKSGMADPQDVAEAKADLQSAQQTLEYYQGLANQNIGNADATNLPKLSEKAMKYLK